MTDRPHHPCPVCHKPVRVNEQPKQKERNLVFHGPKLGVLCPGSGMAVKPKEEK